MAHGEALRSAPPLETGARHVKVGRGGYSRPDVASCASVVRGPRRTIEVEEVSLPLLSWLRQLLLARSSSSLPPRAVASSSFSSSVLPFTSPLCSTLVRYLGAERASTIK